MPAHLLQFLFRASIRGVHTHCRRLAGVAYSDRERARRAEGVGGGRGDKGKVQEQGAWALIERGGACRVSIFPKSLPTEGECCLREENPIIS